MTGGVVLVSSSSSSSSCNGCRGEEGGGGGGKRLVVAKEKAELMMMGEGEEGDGQSQLSLLALVLAALRRSVMSSCRMEQEDDEDGGVAVAALRHMEIGWPTDVCHVTHVTFDRFNGFLGLPVEFELEVPPRAPSASASVFGVSAESMQCSYDSKGNSVPTILLLMQERLYGQGGLKAEGIFRINPENSQEEHVREQLNRGIVPDDIDVHCLAGLIKAWFRELPEGVLDGLFPEQVLQCNTEEEFVELVKLLLPMQTALLNWAIELMADVVEEEELNKMNARNIAMVFAPNMTQMSDPLTALMHAVRVMNLLKCLILKTLRDREDAAMSGYSPFSCSPSSDHHLHDDEYDSQQEELDMSGGSKETSSDEREAELSDSHRRIEVWQRAHSARCSTDDDGDSVRDIEECFLKQLEWKTYDGNSGGDNTSQGVSSTQLACSTVHALSNVSKYESKQDNGNTGTETESNPAKDADAVAKETSKEKESEKLGMADCASG